VERFEHGRFRFAFSDRRGGVSAQPYGALNLGGHVGDDPAAVAQNRKSAAALLGVDPVCVLYMAQVHGADVAVARGPWPDSATASICVQGPRPRART